MSFSNLVPTDNLTPFVFVEFDESGASGNSSNVLSFKNLIIGQSLPTGTVDAGKVVKAQNPELVAKYFGHGSMLHHMAIAHYENDKTTEKYYLSIAVEDELSIGRKNKSLKNNLAASIEITGKATQDGFLSFYIGDFRYKIPVSANEEGKNLAKKLADEIKSDSLRFANPTDLAPEATKIELLARHSGEAYRSIAIQTNLYSDDSDVSGIKVDIKQFSGVVSNPEITDEHIKALGSSTQYNVVMTALNDDSNIKKLIKEFDDRWGPERQIDGHIISTTHLSKEEFQKDSYSQFHTNSKHYSLFYNMNTPSPSFKWSTAIGGVVSFEMQIDPNRQLNEVPIKGLWPPKIEYHMNERNDILRNGVSTWKLDSIGNPLIERVVTQYLKKSSGEKDKSYRDLTIKMTLSYLRYDWRVFIKNKYPRHKLADDGTRFRTGLPIVTPNVIRAEMLTRYKQWEFNGLVEGYELFKKGLLVQRHPDDRDRIDCKIRPDIINQLRTQSYVFAFLI